MSHDEPRASPHDPRDSGRPPRPRSVWLRWSQRHPVGAIFAITIASQTYGSVFNILYNGHLIVNRLVPAGERWHFWEVGLLVYNPLAYVVCMSLGLYVLAPLFRTHARLLAQREVSPEELLRCQRLMLHIPLHMIWICLLGWVGGGIFFPSLVCSLEGVIYQQAVWAQFLVSMGVSSLVTIAQTFFLLEEFLIWALYPLYFRDARPADVGAVRIPYYARLLLLWSAIGLVPLVAMLVIAMNIDDVALRMLLLLVFVLGSASGLLISGLVGGALLRWLQAHAAATERVARYVFNEPVREQRPDEWGSLTDRFNDMTLALGEAQHIRETFGQIVHPSVRDTILRRYPGLGGEVRLITVLFADIRDFTDRSAGEPPEQVVELLNRFLTLAVVSVEQRGGLVNKFLGDGVMALFGAPQTQEDQADQAVQAALDMLARLQDLNRVLARRREPPLVIGIGIHTGEALVGCIGADLRDDLGKWGLRREFTAIGETVNLGQRLEQLTKTLGGPVLISQSTRQALREPVSMQSRGNLAVPGSAGNIEIFQIDSPVPGTGSDARSR